VYALHIQQFKDTNKNLISYIYQKKNKNIFTMYQNSTQLDKYILYTNKERKHKYLPSHTKTSPAICVVLWQWID
jgi:hypothetical protein